MKLIDILARELGKWPERAIVAMQDSDGVVKFSESPRPRMTPSGTWVRDGCLAFEKIVDIPTAEDCLSSLVTRDQWQEARDALEWNGEGLPPVGAKVEVIGLSGDCLPKSIEDWEDGDIVECAAHHSMQGEYVTPVFFNKRVFQFSGLREDCYRPIRTPQQIAAEERKAAIDQMVQFFMNYYGNPKGAEQYLLICRSLHDAGYRKQV